MPSSKEICIYSYTYISIYICVYVYTYIYVCVCVCVHAMSLQLCPTLVTLWTVAHQAPLSMGFSRQEHWSGFP